MNKELNKELNKEIGYQASEDSILASTYIHELQETLFLKWATISISDGLDHAQLLLNWWNDGELMAHAGFPNGLGTSYEVVRQQIISHEPMAQDKGKRHKGLIMLYVNDLPVGEMSYRTCEIPNNAHKSNSGVYEIGIKICDPNFRGKNRGSQFLKMLLRHLFVMEGARLIHLDTNLTNTRAQHVYKKLGFVESNHKMPPWQDQNGHWQQSIAYELSLIGWLNNHVQQITREEIKGFILAHHGLSQEPAFSGEKGLLNYLDKVGCIQYDPIDVCGKSSELTVHAHVNRLNKTEFYNMLYKDRVIFDYFDKNLAILPLSQWPYFEQHRQYYRNKAQGLASHLEQTKGAEEHVLNFIALHGPASSKDIQLDTKVNWYWGPTKLSRATLESLYFQGKLVIHHKVGTNKYYALAENHVPHDLMTKSHLNVSGQSYHDYMVKRRIRAVGALWSKASDAFLGILDFKAENRNRTFLELLKKEEIFKVEVEGINEPLYIAKDDWETLRKILSSAETSRCNIEHNDRVYFIAPLDALIWDRKLIEAIWGYSYRWEIYTPQAQRNYAPYAIPMLYQGEFIGRIEMQYKKNMDHIEVAQIWFEDQFKVQLKRPSFKKQFEKHLAASIDQLKWFLDSQTLKEI